MTPMTMEQLPRWSAAGTREDYTGLRAVLAPDLAALSDDELEEWLAQRFGEASVEDVENFFHSLQRIGQVVAPIAQRALPGIVQGAASGAALGPWGALGGALIGGVSSALATPASRGGRPGPAAAPRPRPAPSRPAPAPSVAPGSPAAGQLLALLSRPEVVQALMQMLLGRAGRGEVSVGDRAVPVGAITNLIGTLAGDAAREYHEAVMQREEVPAYLADATGAPMVDTSVPEERAAAVLRLFHESVPEMSEDAAWDPTDMEFEDEDEDDDDEWYLEDDEDDDDD